MNEQYETYQRCVFCGSEVEHPRFIGGVPILARCFACQIKNKRRVLLPIPLYEWFVDGQPR